MIAVTGAKPLQVQRVAGLSVFGQGLGSVYKRGCFFGQRQLRSNDNNRERNSPFTWLDIAHCALESTDAVALGLIATVTVTRRGAS